MLEKTLESPLDRRKSNQSILKEIKPDCSPVFLGFPCGSADKESACNMGDLGSIPGLGRSPAEGKDYPLQYSGLENSMDCTVHGVTKSWTRLSDFHFHFQVLVVARRIFKVACRIQSFDQGLNLGPLHREHRVLATGPPRKSLDGAFFFSF